MFTRLLLLLYIKCSLQGVIFNETRDPVPLQVKILHMNDVHAHFDQTNVNTGRCQNQQAEASECYGGMSRMYTAIKMLYERDPSRTLVLNAGDYFQGTMWFSKLGYEPIVTFGNMLNWTAMALGNHDFDLGVSDTADFSKQVNYDLLAANLIEDPSVENKIRYIPSKVVEVEGRMIGLIGYITDVTPSISSADLSRYAFLEVISSVRKEAQRLKSLDPPVEILVALGHAGYKEVDLRLAAEVEELDIVVGGHSHSFLYTGTPTPEMVEEVEGEYPTYVSQPFTGRVVPVVQAYKYSKYLGDLTLNFDSAGELLVPVEGEGVSRAEVVLLDASFPQDQWVEERLDEYREQLVEFYPPVGWTDVLLETRRDNTESNLGNIIADSMLEFNDFTDITIAFINDGGIRATIVPGEITGEDIIAVMPFGNTVDRVTMYGRSIRGMLEDYARSLCGTEIEGYPTFLQMAGIKVEYDVWAGSDKTRVSSILTSCPDNPEDWCQLEPDRKYAIALSSFLANGGSRTVNFPDWIEEHEVGSLVDYPALKSYVSAHSPINRAPEGRVIIRCHAHGMDTTTRDPNQ